MADMNAELKLTLSDGAIESQLAKLVADFDRLNATGKQSAVALTEVERGGVAAGEGANVAAKGATEASGAFERLAATLTQVRGAAAVAGEGLTMVGAEAGAVAGKVGVASEALSTLGKTAGPLIAVGIAIAAIGAAFSFITEGVKGAEQVQSFMTSLGAAVESQGKSWADNKEQVEQWLATERMATGFINSELLPALNQLVTAGHNLHDAEIITAVAAEVARAKHMDLLEVTNKIVQAEAGRPQGLARIDLGMKALVDRHASLSQELQYLHKHYANQLNDLNDATLAHARLKGEMEALSEAIGNKLIPFLVDLQYQFIGAMKNAEDLGNGIADMFNGFIEAAKAAGSAIGHFASGMADLAAHNWSGAAAQFKELGESGKSAWKGIAHAAKGYNEIVSEIANGEDAGKRGRHMAGDAVKKHLDPLKDIHVQQLVAPKEKATGGGGSAPGTITGTLFGPYKEQVDAVAQAQAALERVLDANNNSLETFKGKVADSATALSRASAEDALAAQQLRVLEANTTSLNTVINHQTAETSKLDAQHAKNIATLNASAAAHDKLQNAMLAAGGGSQAQQIALQDLTNKHDAAQKALDKTNQLISENTANLDKNQKQVVANADAMNNLRKALTDVQLDWNTFSEKMMRDDQQHIDTLGKSHRQLAAYYDAAYKEDYANYLAALKAKDAATARYYEGLAKADETHVHDEDRIMIEATQSWADFMKKQNLKYAEDLATWQMTNKQKVLFYREAMAQMGAITADNIAQAEQMQQQLLHAQLGAIQDQKKAYKTLLDEETRYTEQFLTDITDKTKGFGDFFKSLWTDLKTHVIHQLAEMIVKSQMFQSIFGAPGQGGILGTVLGGGNKDDQAIINFKASTTDFKASTTDFKTSTTGFRENVTTQQQTTNTFQTSTGSFQSAVDQFMHAVATMNSSSGSGSGGGGLGSLLGFENGIPNFDGGSFNVGGGGSLPGLDAFTGSNLTPNALSLGDLSTINKAPISNGPSGTMPINLTHVAGNALTGMAIGSMIANLDGGNSTWGSIGGGIGGAFGGPIGAAVGGFIGSLFGNHTLGPKFQPDLYNPAWGQADVDWNGAAGAQTFGNQQFTASNQYNVGQGGTPMYKQMENWANAHKDDKSLTQAQQDMLAKILGLEGGNPNADFGVVREANNIAYLANGQSMTVPDLIAMEQAYNNSVGNSAAQYTYKVDRNAPNFSTALVSPWNAPTYPGSGGATDGASSYKNIVAPLPPQIIVNIDNTNGTIVGPGGIESLTQTITTQLQRNLRTGYGNQFGI